MATYFRKGEQPKPLPDIFYDQNNTTYTNLYSLPLETLNKLGFYKGPDAPVISDLFHFNTTWNTTTEGWEVYARDYEERLNIFKGKISDHVNEWSKIQRVYELKIITLDYTTENDLKDLQDSILWVKAKIRALNMIPYRDWQDENVSGFDSDEDYNPEAFNFMNNEPLPSFSRVRE
jgi:hypothetical protein